MPKALPTILNILAFILLVATVVLISENVNVIISWHVVEQNLSRQSLAYPMAAVALLCGLAVGLFAWADMLRIQAQGKRANRELERQNISSEAAESRIEILEGQVRTLEAALDKALKANFPK